MLASDYDSDTEHVARECCYSVRAERSAPKITSAAEYVGICRRIGRARGYIDLEGEGRIDGRLVAVGWNHCPPSQWIGDGQTSGSGEISRFLGYWEAAAERPTVVGSSRNASPEDVYAMLRAGVPAWIARRLSVAGTQQLPRWLKSGQHMTWARRTQLRRIARALSRRDDQNAIYRCGASALEVLGRLCPELQRAALHFTKIRKDATTDWSRPERPWRASDIAWEYVARVQRDMLADQSGRVRAAWAIGRRRNWLLDGSPDVATVLRRGHLPRPALSPAYPHIPEDLAERIVRGETPAQLANGELTPAEAHNWLSTFDRHNETYPLTWFASRHSLGQVRSFAVARWLVSVRQRGDWPLLTKERAFRGPAGETIEVRFADRIDEIQDEDLVPGGSRTGVVTAFERTAQRVTSGHMERLARDHRVLHAAPAWQFGSKLRPLTTPAALVAEGRDMGHCIGGYASAVESGQSVILSVNVFGFRSTVELSPEGRVRQHYGSHNASPPSPCRRVIDRFLRRLRP
jgi:hypothetical protein